MGIETLIQGLDALSINKKEKINGSISLVNSVRDDEYNIALVDRGFNGKMPFVVNKEIICLANKLTEESEDNYGKATQLHGWVMLNVEYGDKKRKGKYRNSVETFIDREGVCGESAMLFIAMARSVGIRASYVVVDMDYTNKRVNHACSMIDIVGRHGRKILVDAAYQRFDVNHKSYRPITDLETFQRLNAENGQ